MHTPAYIFDENLFAQRVLKIRESLGEGIPLCYSIKANPFLLQCLPEEVARVEVCSPGELHICEKLNIPGEKIIYSGVMKELWDVEKAVQLNVGILTAESILHVNLIQEACRKHHVKKAVILRYTSGNQFGMSKEDLCHVVEHQVDYPDIHLTGIHYYSGTQKKLRGIDKDLRRLEELLIQLKDHYNFEPKLVEYGPGLPIYYFDPMGDEKEMTILLEVSERLRHFAEKYPLGIEFGRFLAACTGTYVTKVKDLKVNDGVHYAILDGGMNHLSYYGQTMAMKIPPITCLDEKGICKEVDDEGRQEYTLCGSLCTVADVIVRAIDLPRLKKGNMLLFGKCGAYSVTEANVLFLSRTMPEIFLKNKCGELVKLREKIETYMLNM